MLLKRTLSVVFALILAASAAWAQPDAVIAPTPERIVATLFRDQLISSSFAPQIREIALHYAKRTTFAGNVRINDSPDRRALNIYVFYYRDSLPGFLRNTCNSFPADKLVLCDHRFLDSMPGTPPLALKSTDRLPAPALMYWALGHEIGHIALEHDRSAFLAFASSGLSQNTSRTPSPDTNAGSAPDLRVLNRFEADADRFAISSLPVTARDQWLHFGNPLLDALWWERSRARGSKQETARASSTPAAQKQAELQGPIHVPVADGVHPPMILRLEDLLSTIRNTYANFPFSEGFVGTEEYVIEPVTREQLSVQVAEDDGLFYGSIYLGSDFDSTRKRQALADRAMLMSLLGASPYSELLRASECVGEVRPSGSIPDWQRMFLCNLLPSAKDGEALLKYVNECTTLPNGEALRCYGLIPLVGIACQRQAGAQQAEWCRSERLRDLDRQYAGREFTDGGSEELLEWTIGARYLFESGQASPDPEALDGWTTQAVGQLISRRGSSVGWDLLERHVNYLESPELKDGWQRIFRFCQAAAEIATDVGNDERAVGYVRRMVAIADANVPAGLPIHGYVRRQLARLLRHYGVYRYGSNEAIGFLATPEFEATRAAWDALREESGSMAESAAAAYRRSLDEAIRLGDTEAVSVLHEAYINALGDVVFSYNTLAKTAPALNFARALRSELEAAAGLRTRQEFSTRVLAPALENMATAYLAAPDGDPALAVAQSREALKIRESQDNASPILPLRILAFALYAVGEYDEARRIAVRYAETFETLYGRRAPAMDGALVRGKAVGMADVLATR